MRGGIALLFSNLFALSAPWILRIAIDDLADGASADKLATYAYFIVGVTIFGGFFRFLMRRILIGASRHIEFDIRNDFFAQLQKQPVSFFHEKPTGELMSRAINDMNAVRMVLGPGIMQGINTIFIAITAVILMMIISPLLTVIALIPLPLLSIAVKYFGQKIHVRFEGIQAHFARLSSMVQENLSGVRVVRAYVQEENEVDRFEKLNQGYKERNFDLIRMWSFFYPAMSFLSGLGLIVVLWLGGWLVMRGSLTLGEFVAFDVYLGMLIWPMIALGWVVNLWQRGAASWNRMDDIMKAVPAIQDLPDAVEARDLKGEILIKNLTFTYPGSNRTALENIDIKIPAGTTLALVGHTGAGKSTLIHLLCRLFDPPPGSIFIDGRDMREYTIHSLRKHIGIVTQETFLFSTSVQENLGYGVEKSNREDVEWAARIAHLDEEVAGFPDGYDTLVGERGITLSGGQKQRTAIARAVLRRPTMLFLDDSLSSVDTYTEEAILRQLKELMLSRTSLVVSHRVSTIRHADQIIVLEEGRIAERGNHEDLLGKNGIYAELYRRQQLEEELEAS